MSGTGRSVEATRGVAARRAGRRLGQRIAAALNECSARRCYQDRVRRGPAPLRPRLRWIDPLRIIPKSPKHLEQPQLQWVERVAILGRMPSQPQNVGSCPDYFHLRGAQGDTSLKDHSGLVIT